MATSARRSIAKGRNRSSIPTTTRRISRRTAGSRANSTAAVRKRICESLGVLGIELDGDKDTANADLISKPSGRVAVRIMHTDEEGRIAKVVQNVLSDGK